MATDAAQTDNTVCINSSGLTLKGSGTLGICLGTSGRQFKTALAPMKAGLDQVMALPLWNYRYKSGFGDGGERENGNDFSKSPAQGDRGTLNPSGAYYAAGTKGVTCSGALTVISSITIKNGIITAATGTGGTCS